MSTIRPFRSRSSVPITAELYASTDNPAVVAFQLSAAFYDQDRDPPLTLEGLRKRWHVGLPAARVARRFLIDFGAWAEVNTFTLEDEKGKRHPRPQRCTVTRTSETRFTEEELRDLAAEYPPGTRIECGGAQYIVTAEGDLISAGQTGDEDSAGRSEQGKRGKAAGDTDRQKTAPRSVGPRDTENSRSVRPADSLTGVEKTAGRSEQEKRGKAAGDTDRQKTAPNASSSLRDDEQHACMDEFWDLITAIARVDPPGRRAVREHVATALRTGWTPESLAAWAGSQLQSARDRRRISNPGGFVVSQLKDIPPPAPAAPQTTSLGAPPACDVCGANEGAPRAERVVEGPDGRLRRCACAEPRPAPEGAPGPASSGQSQPDTDGEQPQSPPAADPLVRSRAAS